MLIRFLCHAVYLTPVINSTTIVLLHYLQPRSRMCLIKYAQAQLFFYLLPVVLLHVATVPLQQGLL
jgi:hypothetical protein